MKLSTKQLLPIVIIFVLAVLGYFIWSSVGNNEPGAGFVSGNGRLEATEIDISSKLPELKLLANCRN